MEILIDMMTEILQWYDMFKKTQDRVEEIRKCDSEIIDELTILSTQKLKAKDKEKRLKWLEDQKKYKEYLIKYQKLAEEFIQQIELDIYAFKDNTEKIFKKLEDNKDNIGAYEVKKQHFSKSWVKP